MSPLVRVLDGLRVGLHVMFAFLLGFGLLRSLIGTPLAFHVPLMAAALAALYVAGTVFERHRARSVQSHSASAGSASADNRNDIEPWQKYAWLLGIIVLWLGLLAHSQDFLWLEFPLVFLTLHIMQRSPALLTVAGLWAVAAFVPLWLHPKTWSVAAAIGPLIGTALAVGIFYAYRALHAEIEHHRRIAQQLRATQQELAASEHQAGRLEERERLSREIHDTVAQGLSSIVLLARAARASAAKSSAEPAQQLATIEQVASDNLTEARRFVKDLAAPDVHVPHELGQLIHRMRERGRSLGEKTVFQLEFVGDHNAQIPQPIASAVIRCAQEGLNNVVKHAHATRAVVTYGVFSDAVTIDVVDDGIGKRSIGKHSESGFGLRGLERRIGDIGGTMDIDSGDDGTALSARLPLTSKKGS